MIGMGMKRIVKFLMDTEPEDIIPQTVHNIEGRKETEICIEMYRKTRYFNRHKEK